MRTHARRSPDGTARESARRGRGGGGQRGNRLAHTAGKVQQRSGPCHAHLALHEVACGFRALGHHEEHLAEDGLLLLLRLPRRHTGKQCRHPATAGTAFGYCKRPEGRARAGHPGVNTSAHRAIQRCHTAARGSVGLTCPPSVRAQGKKGGWVGRWVGGVGGGGLGGGGGTKRNAGAAPVARRTAPSVACRGC